MESLLNIWRPLTSISLSDYGSWASIVGLCISLVTLFLVKNLKQSFMFRARVDSQGNILAEKSSELSRLLGNYDEKKDEISDILSKVKVKLRALKKGAKGDLEKDINEAIVKIEKYLTNHWGVDKKNVALEKHAREIYTCINIIIEELDNLKSELVVGS